MHQTRMNLLIAAILLLALASFLAGCASPMDYSDWKWKQYNPNYQPLPGDPMR